MSNGNDNTSGQGQGKGSRGKVYALAGITGIFLVACVIGTAFYSYSNGDNTSSEDGQTSTSTKVVQDICQTTDYQETCINSLSGAGKASNTNELIRKGFQVAMDQIREAISKSSVVKDLTKDPMAKQAVDVCEALLNSSIDDLQMSFERLGSFDMTRLGQYTADLHVWLSGAYTFQESCIDAFENTTGDAGEKMKDILRTSRELTSNALAMVTEMSSIVGSLNISRIGRRLMDDGVHPRNGGLPDWVVKKVGRKLLAATPRNVNPDAVVAKDGSGQYRTIGDALKTVPPKNAKTFVIYVKAGVYAEKVLVDKKMTNVMMIGDGPKKTIVTGSQNFVDGIQTSATGTFSK
ncbi:hypothetical protein SAY86_011397 [Trapa natans]|uniref:Pectinesterase inhibitor domain-containing protein n=1 Tax=Trapa natans TaxID=22666 RepID=A0AAN7R0R2_TRANT|nr:hypothetical protein SAY86_011397 [Trapa natans]